MRIKAIRLGEMRVPLKTPFKTALRTVYETQAVVVAVVLDNGLVGYGEAPPTAVITGDTLESIETAVRSYIGPAIIGQSIEQWDALMVKLHSSIVRNTSAKASVDMALYDLKSQMEGKPLYKLLGGGVPELITDCTISVNTPDEMVRDALRAEQNGFQTLKIKIGKNSKEDFLRMKALSQQLKSSTRLRIDANQGWTPEEAVKIIRKIEALPLQIELIEQPVHAFDFEGLKYVKDRIGSPLLADESVFSPEDAKRIVDMKAADMINIKLMKSAGIYRALKIHHIAKESGLECMVGCMLETPIGVTAAAHFAVASSISRVDLDGPSLCSENPIVGGAYFNQQFITLNESEGLGIFKLDPRYLFRDFA